MKRIPPPNPVNEPQTGVRDLSEVFESISDAFIALDVQWRFTFINGAAEGLLARKRQDLLGRSIWAEFPQAVGSNFEVQYRKAVAEQKTVAFVEFFPPLQEWFSVRAYPTPSGLAIYFQSMTELRRTQAALEDSELRAHASAERLRFALSAAELGDWEWDEKTDRVRLSTRAAEIFGIPSDPPPTRKQMREMIDPQDMDHAREAMESHAMNGRYDVQYRINRPDGRQVWVQARGRSRFNAEGKLSTMIGIMQDITAQKSIEMALHDLAERFARQSRLFEQVATTTPDFIYTFGLDGRFLYANRRLLEVWGVSFEEAVGKSLIELGYPQWHADMHLREIAQVIKTRQPIKGEVPFTGGSGISGVYEYIFTPVLDTQGNVEAIAGTTRDVTERNRIQREALDAKATVDASLARWQAVVNNMSEGLVLVGPDATLLDMNQAALAMHGYTDAAEARKPLDAIAPTFEMRSLDHAVLPMSEWPIPRVLRGETFTNYEVRLLRPDQSLNLIVSFSATPIRDRNGKITLAVLTLHDMTSERYAQASLRESESRFREMFEESPIGMSLNSVNGQYLHANPAYCRIVGRMREALLEPSLDFRDLIHPEDRPGALALQDQLLNGKIPAFFVEKRYVRHDGSHIWVRVTGTIRRDSKDGSVQFVRLVEDINDRKRAEAELAQAFESERSARSEAERASRMKDEFLATLSHELRTPLNAILGWSHILTSPAGSGETTLAEGLRTIERNARAQAQIIEDLLDMSRIISGKIRLDVQQLDLGTVVQTAVDSIKPTAEAKGVRLSMVLDPKTGPISGDPARLQQVMWNLLTNAVKFTPRGGRVQVLLERVNSHLEVKVIDTGEGISAEFLPYVFDRFRQSDASTTRQHGGLGLGLAIVKQLVELHGGTIRARSTGKSEGSTFSVSLPQMPLHADPPDPEVRRHPKAPDSPAVAVPFADVRGVRILVVDDEPDARLLMKRLLEECGAKVLLAATADEALQVLQAEMPDVLVSDIGMPARDGYSLIRNVRALPPQQGGNTPAVALTAYARSEDRMRAIVAGFQHHVSKPVEPAELITMVASLAKNKS